MSGSTATSTTPVYVEMQRAITWGLNMDRDLDPILACVAAILRGKSHVVKHFGSGSSFTLSGMRFLCLGQRLNRLPSRREQVSILDVDGCGEAVVPSSAASSRKRCASTPIGGKLLQAYVQLCCHNAIITVHAGSLRQGNEGPMASHELFRRVSFCEESDLDVPLNISLSSFRGFPGA